MTTVCTVKALYDKLNQATPTEFVRDSQGGSDDLRVLAHAQVIVAAPHGDVPALCQVLHVRTGEVLGRRKFVR